MELNINSCNQMSFTETIDTNALRYVINHYGELAKTYGLKIKDPKNQDNYLQNRQALTLLTKYCKSLSRDGKLKMSYSQRNGKGRFFPEAFGLTFMPKSIRHAIAKETNIDIDIKNCHPTILEHVCKENGIECPNLARYNSNVQEYKIFKQDVLKALNNGFSDEEVKKFEPEVAMILAEIKNVLIPILIDKYPAEYADAQKICKRKKKSNTKGTFMSDLMTRYENNCLQAMVGLMRARGVEVTSLAYDGFTIERNEQNERNINIYVKECEKVILDEMKLELQVVEKPMDCGIQIDRFAIFESFTVQMRAKYKNIKLPKCNLACEMKPYAELASFLKDTIFEGGEEAFEWVINNIDQYIKRDAVRDILYIKTTNGLFETPRETFKVSAQCFHYSLETGKTVEQWNFLGKKSDDLLSFLPYYEGTVFSPNVDGNPNLINTYAGFKAHLVDQVDMDLINPIVDLLKDVWCNGDEDLFDYMKHWLRHIFTTPWIQTGVGVVAYGVEGSGKSLFCNFLVEHVIGERISSVIQGIAPIVQKHNDIIEGKILMCCNEVSTGDAHFASSMEALKSLITESKFSIEIKYKSRAVIDNFLNFMATTNNPLSIPMSEKDRRFLVLLMNALAYEGRSEEYFNRIVSTCLNDEAGCHFYTWICNFQPTRSLVNIPITQVKQNMIEGSLPPIVSFSEDLANVIANVSNPDSERLEWAFELAGNMRVEGDCVSIRSTVVWRAFKAWSEDSGFTSNFTLKRNKFWALFKKAGKGVSCRYQRINGVCVLCVVIDVNKFYKQ